MLVLDDEHRKNLSKPIVRVMAEVIFFALLGLIIGMTVAHLIPNTNVPEESGLVSFLWLVLQLVIDAVIIYVFDKAYLLTFGNDSDEYIGMTIFTNIMLMAQVQIFNRIRNIYYRTTGSVLVSHRIPQ